MTCPHQLCDCPRGIKTLRDVAVELAGGVLLRLRQQVRGGRLYDVVWVRRDNTERVIGSVEKVLGRPKRWKTQGHRGRELETVPTMQEAAQVVWERWRVVVTRAREKKAA